MDELVIFDCLKIFVESQSFVKIDPSLSPNKICSSGKLIKFDVIVVVW